MAITTINDHLLILLIRLKATKSRYAKRNLYVNVQGKDLNEIDYVKRRKKNFFLLILFQIYINFSLKFSCKVLIIIRTTRLFYTLFYMGIHTVYLMICRFFSVVSRLICRLAGN